MGKRKRACVRKTTTKTKQNKNKKKECMSDGETRMGTVTARRTTVTAWHQGALHRRCQQPLHVQHRSPLQGTTETQAQITVTQHHSIFAPRAAHSHMLRCFRSAPALALRASPCPSPKQNAIQSPHLVSLSHPGVSRGCRENGSGEGGLLHAGDRKGCVGYLSHPFLPSWKSLPGPAFSSDYSYLLFHSTLLRQCPTRQCLPPYTRAPVRWPKPVGSFQGALPCSAAFLPARG